MPPAMDFDPMSILFTVVGAFGLVCAVIRTKGGIGQSKSTRNYLINPLCHLSTSRLPTNRELSPGGERKDQTQHFH